MAGVLGSSEVLALLATEWERYLAFKHPGGIQHFKMDEACRSLPVLLLVAKTDAGDVTSSVPPADCLVAKPFTAHDLLKRIRQLLG